MPSTRRQALKGSAVLLASLSGCTQLLDQPPTIAEVEVELVNGRDETHTFLFAFETQDGLSEWHSREVGPDSSTSAVMNPSEGFDPIALHGVVDEQPTRGEVLGVENSSLEEVCLHMIFEYALGDEPTILESSDISC